MTHGHHRNRSITQPALLTVAQAAYIAGIVDSQGRITLRRIQGKKAGRRGVSFRLLLSVHMQNASLVTWLRETTQLGHVRSRTPGMSPPRPASHWEVWTVQAAALLEQLLPYLLLQRRHARLALHFQAAKRQRVGRRGLSDAAWHAQREAHAVMRILNTKEK